MEDLDDGLAAAAESIELAEKASFPLAKGGGLLIMGTVHAITARHDEAEDELSRARELLAGAGDTDREGHALFMLGNLRNWHGRYADGLAQARVGIAAAREKRLVIPLVRCLWVEGVNSNTLATSALYAPSRGACRASRCWASWRSGSRP